MEREALRLKSGYSSKSSLGKAISYFLNHFKQFTIFLDYKNKEIFVRNKKINNLFF